MTSKDWAFRALTATGLGSLVGVIISIVAWILVTDAEARLFFSVIFGVPTIMYFLFKWGHEWYTKEDDGTV